VSVFTNEIGRFLFSDPPGNVVTIIAQHLNYGCCPATSANYCNFIFVFHHALKGHKSKVIFLKKLLAVSICTIHLLGTLLLLEEFYLK
jgi:hypothetical protein